MFTNPGSTMKKVLLSLAVLAASGAYVAFEREHGGDTANLPLGPMPANSAAPTDGVTLPAPPAAPPNGNLSPMRLVAPGAAGGLLPVADVAPATNGTVAQAQVAAGALRDGSFKGPSVDAYWGRIQVEAVVQGGRLTAVHMLQYPSDRRRSRAISDQVLPYLEQEAIANQSANVDTISGATLTSQAYQRSLQSALKQAGGAQGGNNA